MTIFIRRQGVIGDIHHDIARMESLIADLREIANGIKPTRDDLDMAPVIDFWALHWRNAPCLTGELSGHPILDEPIVVTSELQALASDDGWARTRSRFYRLGRRRNAGDVS